MFWKAVARNFDRARRRWQRAQISPIPGEMGPLAFTDGTALQISSDYELAPDLPQGALPLRPPFNLIEFP